jgi:hypothetical protein
VNGCQNSRIKALDKAAAEGVNLCRTRPVVYDESYATFSSGEKEHSGDRK